MPFYRSEGHVCSNYFSGLLENKGLVLDTLDTSLTMAKTGVKIPCLCVQTWRFRRAFSGCG